jgi:hypothetical protein
MAVSFSDLQLAFEFVSSGGMGENEAYLTGSRARSIGIPGSATTTRNCPTISTTRNTLQSRTRRVSISASLWSWISLVSSYPTTMTKFATSSAELTGPLGHAVAVYRRP